MKIKFIGKNVEIKGIKRLYWKNFGDNDRMKPCADFGIVIDDEDVAMALINEGWNVKIKPPRDVDDMPLYYLGIKISYRYGEPNLRLYNGRNVRTLTKDGIEELDRLSLTDIDVYFSGSNWVNKGKEGRTAYLKSFIAELRMDDPFADKYSDVEEEVPFN